jgi:hypothetical protein
MSLIQYQQSTYAVQLRSDLERAGCDAPVAALLSRAVGELIDHVRYAESEIRHVITESDLRSSIRSSGRNAVRTDPFDRFMGAILVGLLAAIACGVLVALNR